MLQHLGRLLDISETVREEYAPRRAAGGNMNAESLQSGRSFDSFADTFDTEGAGMNYHVCLHP